MRPLWKRRINRREEEINQTSGDVGGPDTMYHEMAIRLEAKG